MSALTNNDARRGKAPLKDRLIPWYFVMAFGVVFAVNGFFVYVATSTNRGVVTENSYEKGIRYNETLAAQRAQEALGWGAEITYAGGVLSVQIADAGGQPISGAAAEAIITRPIEAEWQKTLPLTERSSGRYEVPLTLPKKGQWDVTVSILWNDTPFQSHKRLMVK